MKVVKGKFGKHQNATLQEKLRFAVDQLGDKVVGNFLLVTDDGEGSMTTGM